jgi:hypothetical protein
MLFRTSRRFGSAAPLRACALMSTIPQDSACQVWHRAGLDCDRTFGYGS